MTTDGADAHKAVEEAARAARGTVADLAGVPGERLDQALRAIADGLVRGSAPVLAANEEDMTAARRGRPRRRPAGPAPAGRGAAGGHRGPAAGAGRRPVRTGRTGGQGASRRPGAHRAAPPGRRDRRQLRGQAERGGGHRLAVRQVAQRGRAADRVGRDPFGHHAGGRGHRARPGLRRPRPGHDPAGPGARAGLGPGAGQPARPDPAGDPARQRGQHPLAGRRGGAGTGCARWRTPTAARCCTSTPPPTWTWPGS